MIFVSVVMLLVLLASYVFTFPKYKAKTIVYGFYGYFSLTLVICISEIPVICV